jgi:hypothetical protein
MRVTLLADHSKRSMLKLPLLSQRFLVKNLFATFTMLLAVSNAFADGFTYRVTLPEQKTELIHSDESSAAHLSHIHEYGYTANVSHLDIDDWRRLESASQLPKFDVMKCDATTCWYGVRNTVDLGDQVDVSTAGPADNRVTQITVVHSYIDSSQAISDPGQLIPLSLLKVVTFTTSQAARLQPGQPFTVNTPLGDVLITLTETPGMPSASAAAPGNLNHQ